MQIHWCDTGQSFDARAANSQRLGASLEIPQAGLTMGIATLREARNILLLAAGAAKRMVLKMLIDGAAHPDWPVTSLAGHAGLTVIASEPLRSAAD
ncbi:MAG: 6-phosphogluconolactonase [Proteobacteria bacterium]|nr:6-phosphogluconolactonase [Pseudomonadota bacterium]